MQGLTRFSRELCSDYQNWQFKIKLNSITALTTPLLLTNYLCFSGMRLIKTLNNIIEDRYFDNFMYTVRMYSIMNAHLITVKRSESASLHMLNEQK